MKPSNWIAAIIASGALLGLGIAAGSYMTSRAVPSRPAGPAFGMTSASVPMPNVSELKTLNSTFADIAASVSESTVEIRPPATPDGRASMMGGSGSGFIYRADGWIVTNDHVTAGQERVTVVLHDGKEYQGTVYSANDPQLDLAVVKIEASGLTPMDVADSGTVRVGEYAIAVGSPFGYESTVTIGHVSATNRPGRVMDPRTGEVRVYTGMIQTDAAINPGNSGGPLLNIDGQVIGVNSTISTTTGGSNGIGFAIPSNVVKSVADELIAKKKFDRGFLGIQFGDDLKPYRLKEIGIQGGAKVEAAGPDGVAYKAGIRTDDIIVKVDNTDIQTSNDLLLAMYERSPGDKVEITYLRGSQRKTANITLAGAPPTSMQPERTPRTRPRVQQGDPERFFEEFAPDWFRDRMDRNRNRDNATPNRTPGERPRLGVMLERPTPALRTQYRIPENAKGAVITSVAPGSLAFRFGMKSGDLIREINGKAIEGPDSVTSALGKVNTGDDLTVRFTTFSESGQSDRSITIPFE